jgi:predicted ester cyclase
MTREEIVRFFEDLQGDWRARNADGLASAYADEATVVSPMFGALNGREEIGGSYRKLFETFPDWSFKSEELVIDGDRVAQHFVATATHVGEFMGLPGTNRHGRIEGVRLTTMGNNCIVSELRLYDFTSLLIQIGILRSKPAF